MLLELPLHRVKRVIDGNGQVLVGMVQQRLPIYHQLAARYGDVDLHLEYPALAMTQLGHVHDDPAAYDILIQTIQLRRPLTYPRLRRVRAFPMTKGDLEWNFH